MRTFILPIFLQVVFNSYVTAKVPIVDEKLMNFTRAALATSSWTFDTDEESRKKTFQDLKKYFGPNATFVIEEKAHNLGAVIKDTNGLCWYHAPPSNPKQFMDWAENFSPISTKVCDQQNNKTCCTVWDGFYRGVNDVAEIHEKVHECVQECHKKKNEYKDTCLVITGMSRGGGVAAVASVLYDHYNPLVITFAAPPAFVKKNEPSCALNISKPGRLFRFVNSLPSDSFNWVYDPVAVTYDLEKFGLEIFVDGRKVAINGGVHYGEFILFQRGSLGAKYLGLNSNKYFLSYPDLTATAHKEYDQIDVLTDNLIKTGEHLNLTGFSVGSACSYSSHCVPGAKCISGKCVISADIGEFCAKSTDCSRGFCSKNVCKLKKGERCTKASSCVTNKCGSWIWWQRYIPWFWTCL